MFKRKAYFKYISITEAKAVIKSKNAAFVDIRDESSFSNSHIPNAIHLTKNNMDAFLKNKNKYDHLIVYCYHGILSRDAAEFLMNQGFKNAYSLNGGFSEYAQTQTELQRNNEAKEIL